MLEIDTLSVNKRIFNPNESDQSKSIGIWDLTQASVNYDIQFMNSRNLDSDNEEFESKYFKKGTSP